MDILNKYSCVFCKYKNESRDTCHIHGKCNSLSNIYYGKVIECFPFKQIHNISSNISYGKYNKHCEKMDKKYGDYSLENDDFKFIWGVKSWDDLSGIDCNMHSMNDIDITYDKNKKIYYLGIETAYLFDEKSAECEYLTECLNAFTRYMDENKLNKDNSFMLFMSNPCTSISASTIEDLYTEFRIFVEGFCKINNYQKEK